jgi:hypothetical protein
MHIRVLDRHRGPCSCCHPLRCLGSRSIGLAFVVATRRSANGLLQHLKCCLQFFVMLRQRTKGTFLSHCPPASPFRGKIVAFNHCWRRAFLVEHPLMHPDFQMIVARLTLTMQRTDSVGKKYGVEEREEMVASLK